ncbi:hypothetical protein PAPHI01_1066 [Pancytospora philotis]|nr:hypothetical protein PAPHI01_1066 [Pancytospora philotis]
MKNEISTEAFAAFYLSVLKMAVREDPERANAEARALGAATAARMADDFFSKFGMRDEIASSDLGKFVSQFFSNYFGISVAPKGCSFTIGEEWAAFAGECGSSFMCGLLDGVFGLLCPGAVFSFDADAISYVVEQQRGCDGAPGSQEACGAAL